MKTLRVQIISGIIFIMLGIIISVQIKSIESENVQNKRQRNIDLLNQQIVQEQERSLALEEQLKDYEQLNETYENQASASDRTKKLIYDLDKARFYGGLTDVSGEGIVITLNDSKLRITEGVDPNDTVIHDWQLLEIINNLKSWGAQAISINDERIVSTSEIQCAGPTVSVNHIRYAVPFQIKAIGNADYLEASIKMPGNILDVMSIYGIQISIKKDNNIFIPKYRDLVSNVSESQGGIE